MVVSVYEADFIVRAAPDKPEKHLKKSHIQPCDITDKPMKGWLLVEADGCKTKKQLVAWVKEGVEFALTLPSK